MSPPPPSLLRLRAAVAQLARLPPCERAEADRRPDQPLADQPPAPPRSRGKPPSIVLAITAVLTALLLVALAGYLHQLREAQLSHDPAARPSRSPSRAQSQ